MPIFTKRDFIFAVCLSGLVIMVILMLSGCGDPRPLGQVPAPEPGVGDQLRELGSLFLFWGGIVLGLGIIARIVVPGIGSLVAQGGAASVACGAAFTWLADYLWLMALACLLTGLAWAYLHRTKLRSWLAKWKSQIKKH